MKQHGGSHQNEAFSDITPEVAAILEEEPEYLEMETDTDGPNAIYENVDEAGRGVTRRPPRPPATPFRPHQGETDLKVTSLSDLSNDLPALRITYTSQTSTSSDCLSIPDGEPDFDQLIKSQHVIIGDNGSYLTEDSQSARSSSSGYSSVGSLGVVTPTTQEPILRLKDEIVYARSVTRL